MVITIAGPTASGKTELSLRLAEMMNTEIISADSMQIWKGLDIGTAKIDESSRSRIKHHLIDVADFRKSYSVSDWVEAANNIYSCLAPKDVVLAGGTGMYIRAFLYGYTLNELPAKEEIRQKYNEILEKKGREYLFELLNKKTSGQHNLHMNDTKRVIRALEVLEHKGSLNNQRQTVPTIEHKMFILDLDRETLYNRINERTARMIRDGLIDEVRQLVEMGAERSMQSMQAIGYKETLEYLDGNIDKQMLVELISKRTRNYAKRQLTYFRAFPNAVWLDVSIGIDRACATIVDKLKNA